MYGELEEMVARTVWLNAVGAVHSANGRDTERSSKLLTEPVKLSNIIFYSPNLYEKNVSRLSGAMHGSLGDCPRVGGAVHTLPSTYPLFRVCIDHLLYGIYVSSESRAETLYT